MRIRQWDVVNAPDQEITAWLRAMNAVLDNELGDEPPWRADLLRDYLGVAMPGEQRVAWIAEKDSEIVGYLGAVLLGYDATGTACVELFTHPAHRQQGVAARLLATAARYAAERGQDIITAEVVDGTAAVDFYAASGFTRTVTEDSGVLDLSTVD